MVAFGQHPVTILQNVLQERKSDLKIHRVAFKEYIQGNSLWATVGESSQIYCFSCNIIFFFHSQYMLLPLFFQTNFFKGSSVNIYVFVQYIFTSNILCASHWSLYLIKYKYQKRICYVAPLMLIRKVPLCCGQE